MVRWIHGVLKKKERRKKKRHDKHYSFDTEHLESAVNFNLNQSHNDKGTEDILKEILLPLILLNHCLPV